MEWVKVGTDFVVGAGVGAIDQVVQNADEKRESEKGEKLGIMAQYGTYYNYGGAIASLLAVAFGLLKGDWATRALTAGAQLAGRKGTWHITKRERVVAYTRWTRDRQLEAQRAEAQRLAAAKAREPAGKAVPQIKANEVLTIPVVSEGAILA